MGHPQGQRCAMETTPRAGRPSCRSMTRRSSSVGVSSRVVRSGLLMVPWSPEGLRSRSSPTPRPGRTTGCPRGPRR
ncbi:hypothetical protein [Ornithinimicrobium kibberense]|uniref:hypothetical protein n=1 Tax=Ornithinimicrobium kibberense TaxID=282060 RepID=UPI0036208E86